MSLKNALIFYVPIVIIIDLALVWRFEVALLLLGYFYLIKRFALALDWRLMILVGLATVALVASYPREVAFSESVSGRVVAIQPGQATIQTGTTKVRVYYDQGEITFGDYVELQVVPLTTSEYHNLHGFDYSLYLESLGIRQVGWVAQIERIEPRATLGDWLIARLDSDNPVNNYARMFVLGVRDETIDTQALVNLSIIHLFALSGMHLEYLKKFLSTILGLILPRDKVEPVSYLMIGFYLANIPENIAFARALGVGMLGWALKDRLNKMDVLALVTFIFISRNPMVVFNLGFVFSFSVYFIILLWGKTRLSFVLIFLGSLPIVIATNYRINLVSLLLTPLLAPLVEWLYLAVVVYTLGVPGLVVVVGFLVSSLENIVAMASDLSLFLNFAAPSLWFLGIYYGIYARLIVCINAGWPPWRQVARLAVVLGGYSLICGYSPLGQVTMIDVGQGDCFLISQPFNQGNILIDTGGNLNYDLAARVVVPYLRSQGIHHLDQVVISHDDFDHSGAYESLAGLIEIDNTITSYQPTQHCGLLELEFLDTGSYDNKNDNSLVVHVMINGLGYLFLGDVSQEVEQNIVTCYPDLRVDVLKVSHHGSATGSAPELLGGYLPEVALLSVGRNNIYHHPQAEVLERLENYGITVYRSDCHGAVTIEYLLGGANYIDAVLVDKE